MFKRVVPLVLFILPLVACGASVYDSAYRTLSVSKTTIETAAVQIKQAHRLGQISDMQLEKARIAYNRAKASQDVVVNSIHTSLDLGVDPNDDETYVQAVQLSTQAILELTTLLVEFGIIKE